MAEMASLWDYAEHRDLDQLGQKLLYTTLELEKLKSEAIEEMRINKEYINQLIHLLKSAIQERDEARNNLHKLITTTAVINPPPTNSGIFPAIKPAKANPSITESNSLSDTHNYHSYGGAASPVDSLFDAAMSPEFSKFQNSNNISSLPIMMPKLDRGSMIMDNIVKGRVLPEKGKLLQAVRRAGPLLRTLMVAGPLPQWRNPPQMAAFQIPPVALKQMSSFNCNDVLSNLSDFSNANCGSNASSLISSALSSNGCFRLPKRQRFC